MFKTKKEYLTWRSQWKAEYAALSTEIRACKTARKSRSSEERSAAQVWCYLHRKKATALLEKRAQSKVMAQQCYLAAKTALAVQTA